MFRFLKTQNPIKLTVMLVFALNLTFVTLLVDNVVVCVIISTAWCGLMWSTDDILKSADQDYHQKSSCLKLLLLWNSSHVYCAGDSCLFPS